MILGIDPGFGGALAFLVPASKQLTVIDIPVVPTKTGKKELNIVLLSRIIYQWREVGEGGFAVIERVGSMPGQGVASAFNFGKGYGIILGILAGNGIETRFVAPAKWKKHYGLTKDKGLSRALATKHFPDNAQQFSRMKDDGRAEAALIALYGSQNPTSLL